MTAGAARRRNLYADPNALVSAAGRGAGGVTGPRDIGFRFGTTPTGGDVVAHRDVEFPSAVVGLTWDGGRGRWTIEPGGEPVVPAGSAAGAAPVGAATVVVQRVTTRPSAIRDAAGAVSPYAVTIGAGDAEVLRDGRAFPRPLVAADADRPHRVRRPGRRPRAVRARSGVGAAGARGLTAAPSGNPPHMGTDDKIDNKADQVKGKVKEGIGNASDDEDLKAEGKKDQAKGDIKQAGEKVKDAFKS